MSRPTRPRRLDRARSQTVRIKRFDPVADRQPRWEGFRIEAGPTMTVLDALFQVVERHDASLGFRASCGAGACGSCAMVIDGREGLACRTLLDGLGTTVRLEPLRHLPVAKDLVVDMTTFFAKYAAVKPYFVGDGSPTPAVVPPGAGRRDIVDRQLECITCGACYSACPIVSFNPHYLGPAALNRAYCLVADERDVAGPERLALVACSDAALSCRGVSNCLDVCPRGIEPLFSIQRLRKRALALAVSGRLSPATRLAQDRDDGR